METLIRSRKKKCFKLYKEKKRSPHPFDIEMYGEPLNFKKHLSLIEESLNERLKVIKILTHDEWGIIRITLISIYKSLMRSLIEYSSSIFYLAPPSSTKRFQTR